MATLLQLSMIFVCVSVTWGQSYYYESGTNSDGSMWSEWKTTYNYDCDPEEEEERKSNFMKSHHRVHQHNQKKPQTYSTGHNEFSAMSDDEFRKNMMGLQSEIDCDNSSLTYKAPDNPDIPDSIDYRDYGYVTPVKTQGDCGACWAFVAIGSLEGQHKRITGKLVELSEQHLVDCSRRQGNMGCDGGIMCRAFEYASDIEGVDTEEAYPYTGVKTDGQCHYDPKGVGSPVGGYLTIPKGDEETLKAAVGLIGPVAAGFDGHPHNFRYYKGGIFSDPSCDPDNLSHALTIIGYGTENGTDYWLVKNSWGTSWGDNGFGKIRRNHNSECGIAHRAVFPVLHKDKHRRPVLDGPAASP